MKVDIYLIKIILVNNYKKRLYIIIQSNYIVLIF